MKDDNRKLDLMAFTDGEPGDAPVGPEEERFGENQRALGELLRTSLEIEADSASEALGSRWSDIEAAIGAPSSEPSSSRAPAADGERGFFAWLQEQWGGLLLGAAAAAAIAFLAFRPADQAQPTQASSQDSGKAPALVPASLEHAAPQIEDLEVHQGNGFVLTIPGADGESDTAVIWVTDDKSEEEDPI